MLNTSNIMLLVGLTDFNEEFSPRKITIWSTLTNGPICSSYSFTSKINVAKINGDRMIVCERNYIHIYSTEKMEILKSFETGYLSLGRIALSPNRKKNSWFCFSNSNDQGLIKIYDTLSLNIKTTIQAHKSPILKLCINSEGDKLATCSCKGTIIRIFSLPDGMKLLTFKRGISTAFIFYMNFSMNSDKLISSSESGILHVFDVKQEMENGNNHPKGLTKNIGRFFVTVAAKIMPSDYEDSFGRQGAMYSYTGVEMEKSNIVWFNPKNSNEALCFNSDGNFYVFSINTQTHVIEKTYERNIKDLKNQK